MNCLKNTNLLCFFGGLAAAMAGAKLVKSGAVRKAAVSGLARAMRLQKEAQEALANLREDACDLCCEAERKSKEKV